MKQRVSFPELFFKLFKQLDTRANRVLFYFFVSYFLLILMPFIVAFTSLTGTVSLLVRQYVDSSAVMVHSSAVQVESALSASESYASSTLPSLQEFNATLTGMAASNGYDALDIRALYEGMPALSDTSGVIRSSLLYHWGGRFMIQPGLGYQQPDRLYPGYISYGDLSFEAFRDKILLNTAHRQIFEAQPCKVNNSCFSCILMCTSYSGRTNRGIGQLLFFLDADRMLGLFNPLISSDTQTVLILDSDGQVLASSGRLTEKRLTLARSLNDGLGVLSRRREIASYYKTNGGWTYAVITPRALFVQQAFQALMPMLICLALMLVAIVALGVSFLHKQSTPLNRIIDLLPGMSHKNAVGFSDLEQIIVSLRENQQLLEDHCTLQAVQLRDACLKQIIDGTLFDAPSFDSMLKATHIHLGSPFYRGAYMFLDGQSDRDESLDVSMISECLARYGTDVQMLMPVAPRHYILMLSCTTRDGRDEAALRLLAELHTAITNQFHLQSVFYVGVPVSKIENLHYSLESARSIMCIGQQEEQYLCIAEQSNTIRYDYTDQEEAALYQQVRGGRKEEVQRLLGQIFVRNFHALKLSSYHVRLLYARVCNTLLRCADDFGEHLPEEFLKPDIRLEPDEFFKCTEKFLLHLCEQALIRYANESQKSVDRMVEYIHQAFCRPDMSLSHLSLQFGFSEAYISTMLHSRLGQTFAVHLEELRISRAMKLLKDDPDLSIEQLAADVGYINLRTFQRAFMRIASCSPSKYRSALKKSPSESGQ